MSTPVREEVLHLNGIDLHVTRAGEGSPLLLLHGVTGDATFERHEIQALSQSRQVIAPDLRGHGRSTRPPAFTLEDLITDMVALLDELKIERVDVVGTSMGSYVAQGLALARPERVNKLVLVVARASGTTSSSERVLAEHADELRGLTREEQQQWLNARMFAPQTPDEVRQRLLEWILERQRLGLAMDSVQIKAANDAVLGFDFRERLPGLHVPTLVISGRHDILNPPHEGEQLAKLLPDAQLQVFEDSGHLLAWEQPEGYVAAVSAFLGA